MAARSGFDASATSVSLSLGPSQLLSSAHLGFTTPNRPTFPRMRYPLLPAAKEVIDEERA